MAKARSKRAFPVGMISGLTVAESLVSRYLMLPPAPLVGGGEAADRRGELWTTRQASAMSRRPGLSNPLLFARRKAHGDGRLGAAGVCGSRAGDDRSGSAEEAEPAGRRIEVVSVNGSRVTVEPKVDVKGPFRIMRGPEALR